MSNAYLLPKSKLQQCENNRIKGFFGCCAGRFMPGLELPLEFPGCCLVSVLEKKLPAWTCLQEPGSNHTVSPVRAQTRKGLEEESNSCCTVHRLTIASGFKLWSIFFSNKGPHQRVCRNGRGVTSQHLTSWPLGVSSDTFIIGSSLGRAGHRCSWEALQPAGTK